MKKKTTKQWIEEYAGKKPAAWIAEQAGVTEGWLRVCAHQLKISLRASVPIKANVKDWVRFPPEELSQYTVRLNAIRERNEEVLSKADAIRLAVWREGGRALRDLDDTTQNVVERVVED